MQSHFRLLPISYFSYFLNSLLALILRHAKTSDLGLNVSSTEEAFLLGWVVSCFKLCLTPFHPTRLLCSWRIFQGKNTGVVCSCFSRALPSPGISTHLLHGQILPRSPGHQGIFLLTLTKNSGSRPSLPRPPPPSQHILWIVTICYLSMSFYSTVKLH